MKVATTATAGEVDAIKKIGLHWPDDGLYLEVGRRQAPQSTAASRA